MSARLYGTQSWRRRARAQLLAEPLCRACRARGRLTTARVADHVERWDGVDAAEFFEAELQSLCDACHQAKRAAELRDKAWSPKLGTGTDGRPLDPSHPWHR